MTGSATESTVLVVAGPTASGKSALAMDLAHVIGGVVVNADSMQVYRELRVLTARPSPEDERRVPHRLFGVLPAAEVCSAGRWLTLASAEVDAARAAGRQAVFVGGTGFYLRALMEGLAPIPPIPDAVRTLARTRHARLGGEAFRAELAVHDPESAARIPATDSQRLMRAWEVAAATGRPLPAWQREGPAGRPVAARFVVIAVIPPRETVYAAAEARFDAMLAEGAIDEVVELRSLGLDPGLPVMKAVGVRELGAYLDGRTTLVAAATAAKKATRNYAKRQLTWLRHQLSADATLEEAYDRRLPGSLVERLRSERLLPRAAPPPP